MSLGADNAAARVQFLAPPLESPQNGFCSAAGGQAGVACLPLAAGVASAIGVANKLVARI
jgi:hypothetical protein